MGTDALSKAVRAAVDYLNSSGEYVGKVDDPTDICLDGWFDIDQLVTKAVEAYIAETTERSSTVRAYILERAQGAEEVPVPTGSG